MATLNLPSRQRGEDLYLLFEARVCSMYIICVLDVSSDTFYFMWKPEDNLGRWSSPSL